MEGTLDFDSLDWGAKCFNLNNSTETHSIFLKLQENTFLGMPEVRACLPRLSHL